MLFRIKQRGNTVNVRYIHGVPHATSAGRRLRPVGRAAPLADLGRMKSRPGQHEAKLRRAKKGHADAMQGGHRHNDGGINDRGINEGN